MKRKCEKMKTWFDHKNTFIVRSSPISSFHSLSTPACRSDSFIVVISTIFSFYASVPIDRYDFQCSLIPRQSMNSVAKHEPKINLIFEWDSQYFDDLENQNNKKMASRLFEEILSTLILSPTRCLVSIASLWFLFYKSSIHQSNYQEFIF